MINDVILQVKDLGKVYIQGNSRVELFNGVNFSLKQNEMVALLGPSGSGKTSLLNILGMLDSPSSGDIFIGGQKINHLSDKEKTTLRGKNIGFVFQFHNLLPDFTALENVMMPQLILGETKGRAKEHAMQLLLELGLENRYSHFPSTLSGGEQQRVSIARAVSTNPALIIADEPTGNLDVKSAQHVFDLLLNTAQVHRSSIILATHDINLANKMNRKFLIRDTALVQI